MSPALELILTERLRQKTRGYDALHDDKHENGELADAAACYAAIVGPMILGADAESFPATVLSADSILDWPFEEEDWKPSNDPIRNLVKAGAMIVAEIERLQREFAR